MITTGKSECLGLFQRLKKYKTLLDAFQLRISDSSRKAFRNTLNHANCL